MYFKRQLTLLPNYHVLLITKDLLNICVQRIKSCLSSVYSQPTSLNLWLLFLIAIQIIFVTRENIQANFFPRYYDDALYLRMAIEGSEKWLKSPTIGSLKDFYLYSCSAKPPMLSWLLSVEALVFNKRVSYMLSFHLVTISILSVFITYRFLAKISGTKAAVVGILLLMTSPMWIALQRIAYQETVLFIFLAALLYTLQRKIEGAGYCNDALIGIFAAGALLCKQNAVLWMAGPFAYAFIKDFAKGKMHIIKSWSVIFSITLIIAGPFYFHNINALWQYTKYLVSPETLAKHPLLKGWEYINNTLAVIGKPIIAALVFLFLLFGQTLKQHWHLQDRSAITLMLLSAAPSFIIFGLSGLYNFRYFLPSVFLTVMLFSAILLNERVMPLLGRKITIIIVSVIICGISFQSINNLYLIWEKLSFLDRVPGIKTMLSPTAKHTYWNRMDPLPFDELFLKLKYNEHYLERSNKLIVIYDPEKPPSRHAKNPAQWRLYMVENGISLDFQDNFVASGDSQMYLSSMKYKGYIADFVDKEFLSHAKPEKAVPVGQVEYERGLIRLYYVDFT